ncbi:MAG: hypothetical protein GY765_24080, partial [bacterium]|nr:hypothetical protein [bacterium]
YQPVFSYTAERASGLNMFLGSSDMELWKLFPAFNTKTGSGHLANWIWVGVLIGALLIYYFRPFKKFKLSFAGKGREITALCLFVLFGYLYCFHPHVHLIDRGKFMGKGISFFKTSRNFIYLEPEKVFRIKGGQFYDIFIHRDMTRKSKVILNFKETDVVSVTVRHGKRVLFQSKGHASEMYQLPITKLSSIHVDGKRISHLGIETRTSKKNGFLYMEIK